VYGMPKAVAEAGISQAALSLQEMARSIMDLSLDSQGLNS